MTNADTTTETTAPPARQPAREPPPMLPSEARAKFLLLQGMSQDAREAVDSAHRRVGDLSRQLSYGGNRPAENADALQSEIARLRDVGAKQSARHHRLSALVASLSHWLRSLPPSVVLEYRRTRAPQLDAKQTATQAVEHLREQVLATRQNLRAVELAPLPRAALRRTAKVLVEQMVARGRPRLVAGRTLDVRWGDERSATPGVTVDHVAAIAAWLDPDAMLGRLVAEIDALPEPKLSLSEKERDEKLAELRTQMDALERSEEALIALTHERDGVEIMRRADASPTAVLSVERAKFKDGDR
jgi:hypothetical protein